MSVTIASAEPWRPRDGPDRAAARNELYHSSGSGLLRIPGFLDAETCAALRRRWTAPGGSGWAPPVSNSDAGPGAPAYCIEGPFDQTAWCFGPWNAPPDSLTFSVLWAVQTLRNGLQGHPAWSGLAALDQGWVQARVVQTRGGAGFVRAHADYAERPPATPLGSHRTDLGRLQATLLLSTPGEDWTGVGFWVSLRDGTRWTAGNGDGRAGDLLLWVHALEHGVGEVTSSDGAAGFLRILFPHVVPGPR